MRNLFFILLAFAVSFQTNAKTELSSWQKAAIATRFASEVKYNFAEYDRFALNFDSICREELPDLVNTATDEEFNDKLILFANKLKDGHTNISYNADVAFAPITHKRIGDKVFITGVYSEDYKQRGVKYGTELVGINDLPVVEYGNKYVVPFIPSSTPQWSETYPFNSINLTKGLRGEPIKLTFKNANEEKFDIIDERQSPWGIVNTDLSMKFETLPGNIGWLKIPSFQPTNFNMETFIDLFEKKILPTDGLIIDIRDNTGGNSEIGDVIMMALATDTIPQAAWETPKYEATYTAWGRKWGRTSIETDPLIPFFITHPSEMPKYDKPIVLLINGSTFSAAEDFTILFKNAKRGKVIGTPTAGSTGQPIFIDLGWGYYGRICTRHERLADGTEFMGIGIKPDIFVEENEGVLFGKDNIIEEALKQF